MMGWKKWNNPGFDILFLVGDNEHKYLLDGAECHKSLVINWNS